MILIYYAYLNVLKYNLYIIGDSIILNSERSDECIGFNIMFIFLFIRTYMIKYTNFQF